MILSQIVDRLFTFNKSISKITNRIPRFALQISNLVKQFPNGSSISSSIIS